MQILLKRHCIHCNTNPQKNLIFEEYDWLKDLENYRKNENPEHSYEYTKLQMFRKCICFTKDL